MDGYHNGFEVHKSLKTTSMEDGERKLEAIRKTPDGNLDRLKTLEEACNVFLSDAKARHLSPDTIRKQKNILIPFLAFCATKGRRSLKQVTFEDISEFRSSWKDQALSASKKLERFRSIYSFWVKAGLAEHNIVAALKPPVVKDCPTLPFNQAEMLRLFDAFVIYSDRRNIGTTYAERLKALMMTLRYTGMRIRDAVMLSEDKVMPGRIFLYQQKTGEPVYVPIPEELNKMLANLPGRTSDTYFFWTGNGNPKSAVGDWQRSFRRLFELARVIDGHPHRFRDTFAVELLLAGVPIEDVSILLGHSSIKTTQKSYTPWVRARQEKLALEVEKAISKDAVLDSLKGTSGLRLIKKVS